MYSKSSLKPSYDILRLSLWLLVGCTIGGNNLSAHEASKAHQEISRCIKIVFPEKNALYRQYIHALIKRDEAEKRDIINQARAMLRQEADDLAAEEKQKIAEALTYLEEVVNANEMYQWVYLHYCKTTHEVHHFAEKSIAQKLPPLPPVSAHLQATQAYAKELKDSLANLDAYCEVLLVMAKQFEHMSKHWPMFTIGRLEAQVATLQAQVAREASRLEAPASAAYSAMADDLLKMQTLLAAIVQFLVHSEEKWIVGISDDLPLSLTTCLIFDQYLHMPDALIYPAVHIEDIKHAFEWLDKDISQAQKTYPLQGLEGCLKELKGAAGYLQGPTSPQNTPSNRRNTRYAAVGLGALAAAAHQHKSIFQPINIKHFYTSLYPDNRKPSPPTAPPAQGKTPQTSKGKLGVALSLILAAGAGYQGYKKYFTKEKPKIATGATPASHKKWLFFILCLLMGGLLLMGILSRKKAPPV